MNAFFKPRIATLTQIPQPIQSSSDMKAIFAAVDTSIHNFPANHSSTLLAKNTYPNADTTTNAKLLRYEGNLRHQGHLNT
jgi:hypothetical protein